MRRSSVFFTESAVAAPRARYASAASWSEARVGAAPGSLGPRSLASCRFVSFVERSSSRSMAVDQNDEPGCFRNSASSGVDARPRIALR